MGRDPHHVLGVAPGASQDEIRAAYRSAARRLHPDRAGHDPRAADHMAELNAAYAALQRRNERPPMSAAPADQPPARPIAPVVAARFPWRLVAGLAVVGSLIVIAGALFATPEDPERPDGCCRSEVAFGLMPPDSQLRNHALVLGHGSLSGLSCRRTLAAAQVITGTSIVSASAVCAWTKCHDLGARPTTHGRYRCGRRNRWDRSHNRIA